VTESSAVEALLERARGRLERVTPEQAAMAALGDGGVIVDIRSESQRARDGVVPGSVFIARNVLEWRCDPASEHRDPRVGGLDRQLIVMCDGGYQSSLAAANLQELGFMSATDLAGGFQAWRAAGLPVEQA
jgi:rhodanese-related sulfurtransferase